MGNSIKENYSKLGIGIPPNNSEIVVTGSPNYEFVRKLPAVFTGVDRLLLRRSLNIPDEAYVYLLFLSPSKFDNVQIDEVVEVISTLDTTRENTWFVLKFHPKTRSGEPQKIIDRLGLTVGRMTVITAFSGDEYNAKLILMSNCLVQKQSTVGYIAMMLGVPILSYNLKPTDYDDEMYRIIDGSYHAESAIELISYSKELNGMGLKILKDKQTIACDKYCRSDCSPSAEISMLISRHLDISK